MSKIYSLLRNNQQTGPYSLEELVQLQLKPFDLVWAEGKSAGWLYPSEIDALKPYLEPVAVASPQQQIQSPQPEVLSTKPVVATVEPLAKKSSKAVYVSLPAGINPAAVVRETLDDGAGGEPKESFEERVEQIRRRVAAVESGEKRKEEGEEINTKYSRSLDDIKEEYTSWLKKQKSKKRFPVKKLVISAAALVFLTLGGWLAYAFISNEPAPVLAVQKPFAEAAMPVAGKENIIKPEYDMPGDASTRAVIEHLDNTLEVLEANEKKAEKKKTIPEAVKKQVTDPVRTVPVPAERQGTETASRKATGGRSIPSSTETPRQVKSPVPLSKLVNIQGRVIKARKGIDGVEITLQNNSDQALKLVAVDVMYHKGGNRVIQRETVYFSDILPGTSRMLVAPGNKNALGANYQLGLISAEDRLYVSR